MIGMPFILQRHYCSVDGGNLGIQDRNEPSDKVLAGLLDAPNFLSDI